MHRPSVRTLAVPLLLFLACSSGSEPPEDEGEVALDTASLDFGPVFTGSPVRRVVRLKNRGRVAGAVEVTAGGPFSAKVTAGRLGPGRIADVEVVFAPDSPGRIAGTLDVTIAGVPGTASIPLSGEGIERAIDAPDHLAAGAVRLGSSARAELRVKNPAALPQVLALKIDGPDAAAFSLESLRLALEPGAESAVGVIFTPAVSGSAIAGLRLLPCEECAGHTVQLTGEAWRPVVEVVPATVDFGHVPPGATARVELELRNGSEGPVPVSSARLLGAEGSPFSVEVAGLPSILAPGAMPLAVTFAPAERGASATSLLVEVAGSLVEVPIRGEGGEGGMQVRPAALEFGAVPAAVGSTLAVTITDVSGADRQVQRVSVEGPDAVRFSARASRPLPTVVRDPLAIDVELSSAEPGTFAASLVIAIEGEGARRVPLTATVLAGGHCQLELDPPWVDFGLSAYGETAERRLRLRNTASLECTVGPFELAGSPAFSMDVDPAMRRLIPARSSISLAVRYTPRRGTGPDVATLSFEQAHATVHLLEVPLSGRGSEPALVALTPILEFSAGLLGGEHLMAVDLRNVSPVPLRIVSQQVVPATGRFTLAQPAPADVPVGGQVTAHVRHTAGGVRASADLEILVEGASAPLVVPLAAPAASESCGTSCPAPIASCPGAFETWLQRDQAITGGSSAAGAAAECSWAVATSPGGSAAMPADPACLTFFRADVPGRHELELTARAGERTAACRTAVDVEPHPGLWIERRPAAEVVDLHLFLPSAGVLDEAGTWSALDGHAWRRRVRPDWGREGGEGDPILERGGKQVAEVIRLAAPELDGVYEVGVHRVAGVPGKPIEVETVLWCGGVPAATLLTRLEGAHTAAHLGTVRFTGPDTCTFTPGTIAIEVEP